MTSAEDRAALRAKRGREQVEPIGRPVREVKQPKAKKRARPSGRARPSEPLAERCEICEERPATHRHHRLPRSAGGGDEAENTLDLDAWCHGRVHANPEWSYEHGYLIRRPA